MSDFRQNLVSVAGIGEGSLPRISIRFGENSVFPAHKLAIHMMGNDPCPISAIAGVTHARFSPKPWACPIFAPIPVAGIGAGSLPGGCDTSSVFVIGLSAAPAIYRVARHRAFCRPCNLPRGTSSIFCHPSNQWQKVRRGVTFFLGVSRKRIPLGMAVTGCLV